MMLPCDADWEGFDDPEKIEAKELKEAELQKKMKWIKLKALGIEEDR